MKMINVRLCGIKAIKHEIKNNRCIFLMIKMLNLCIAVMCKGDFIVQKSLNCDYKCISRNIQLSELGRENENVCKVEWEESWLLQKVFFPK